MAAFTRQQFVEAERLLEVAWSTAEEGKSDAERPLVRELRSALLLEALNYVTDALGLQLTTKPETEGAS